MHSESEVEGVRREVGQAILRLRRWVEPRDFSGADPYDALRSPVVRAMTLGTKTLRIAATQFLRRSPVDIRPLLGVTPGRNPKGLGLFLGGYARLAAAGDSTADDWIERLLDYLEEARSRGCHGNAWGYHFDWQSRAFFVSAGTPTVVNTAFIGHALLDAWHLRGNTRARDLALPIRDFVLGDLNRTGDDRSFCFSYTPGDRLAVHNANMLGASMLARLHALEPHPESAVAARAALLWSMERQRPDGSWPYAETAYQGWIDSFHTGFNLEALWHSLGAGVADEWRESFERGTRYYRENFFLPDGAPKYYHDRQYPIDIHCPAQGIRFFSLLGDQEDLALAATIARWMLANMSNPDGSFAHRRSRWLVNRIPYMRWNQAWVFHALALLAHRLGPEAARAA